MSLRARIEILTIGSISVREKAIRDTFWFMACCCRRARSQSDREAQQGSRPCRSTPEDTSYERGPCCLTRQHMCQCLFPHQNVKLNKIQVFLKHAVAHRLGQPRILMYT